MIPGSLIKDSSDSEDENRRIEERNRCIALARQQEYNAMLSIASKPSNRPKGYTNQSYDDEDDLNKKVQKIHINNSHFEYNSEKVTSNDNDNIQILDITEQPPQGNNSNNNNNVIIEKKHRDNCLVEGIDEPKSESIKKTKEKTKFTYNQQKGEEIKDGEQQSKKKKSKGKNKLPKNDSTDVSKDESLEQLMEDEPPKYSNRTSSEDSIDENHGDGDHSRPAKSAVTNDKDNLLTVNPQTVAEEPEIDEDEVKRLEIEKEQYKEMSRQASRNLNDFVFQPAPNKVIVRCRVTRDRRNGDGHFGPTYQMHLEHFRNGPLRSDVNEKPFKFLLAARKRRYSATSNYLISANPCDLSREGDNFLGKVRANIMGTNFTVYDNGQSPSKRSASHELRKELAAIIYDTNVLGFRGPRKMTIIIPGMHPEKQRVEVQPVNENQTLIERRKHMNMDNLLQLNNKSPVWNEETQSYVLNFHGRVTQPSIKNFQIIHEKDPDYIVMQFGRISDDVFTCDFQYPMCAIQAFGIALSSFDHKLACE
ncbi:hypothetical protein SNEBB_004388 [Seison nebaliae]|nr:hypothetical protein SNEBB_004388 [Seison nebaliae]